VVEAAVAVAGNLFVRPTSSERRLLAGCEGERNRYPQA
jgi:hypothetical protein